MGYYGDEKIRQMSRSILPATRASHKNFREAANAIRRHNRRIANEQTRQLRGPASDVIDMFDDCEEDLEHYVEMHRSTEIHSWWWPDLVRDRREHDHLNHFIRWAKELTKHMDPEDRYDYMASIMPKNAMGAHAMQHLKFELDPEYIRRFELWGTSRKKVPNQIELFDQCVEALRPIAHSDHKRDKLNRYLNRVMVPHVVDGHWVYQYQQRVWIDAKTCDAVRIMRGYHDAQRFITDIWRGRCGACSNTFDHRHSDWVELICAYLNVDLPDQFFPQHRLFDR